MKIFLIIFNVILFGVLTFICCNMDEFGRQALIQDRAVWQAWTKANGKTNLTFEEFTRLKEENLLPGQAAKDNTAEIALSLSIMNAANNSTRR